MIEVATFGNLNNAQIFADYCQSQGWLVSVVPLPNGQAQLFVAAPVLAFVQAELHQFQQHPQDPKYQAAAWQVGTPKTMPTHTGGHSLWQRVLQATGPLTQFVALGCIGVFILLHLWPNTVFRALSLLPWTEMATVGFSTRWLTPAFLHFSIEHLAFNLLAWLIYAGRMERHLGSGFLLGFLLVTAVVSNSLQLWVTGPAFGGLSGVCFALFGFAWVYGMRYPQQALRIERADFVVSLLFLGLGFADMLWVDVANYAHVGGLIAGIVLALIPFKGKGARSAS